MIVPVANGLLDIEKFLAGATRQEYLLPHTPRYFSFYCLPPALDESADCPKYMAFLKRVFANDQGMIRLAAQTMGYLLTPDTSQQKFFIAHGSGSNGKSVWLASLEALLGPDAISHVPLERFDDRFALSGTRNKLANIVAEVSEVDRVAEGVIKQFVGGDRMQFERKFREPYVAQPTARLVFSCNTMPRFSDRTGGMKRRLIVLPFSVVIPEHEKNLDMVKPEYWADELSGILNFALAGLYDLRQQRRFIVPEAAEQVAESHWLDCNPARRFLLENCKANPQDEIPKAELYKAYREYAAENGQHPLSEPQFAKEVIFNFPNVKPTRRRVQGERLHFYEGIVWDG